MQGRGVELVGACAVYGNHTFLGCCASSWFGGLFKWKSSRLQSSRAATANKQVQESLRLSFVLLITIFSFCFMLSETYGVTVRMTLVSSTGTLNFFFFIVCVKMCILGSGYYWGSFPLYF